MSKKTKNKGGRPALEKGKNTTPLSISVSWSDFKLFMAYKEISGKSRSEFFRDIFQEWLSEHTPPIKCNACTKFLTKFERDNEENKDFGICYKCWEGSNEDL